MAGLAFAYAPYRLGQLSHIQVLSSYWMPLALVGFRRYFVRRSAGDRARRLTRARRRRRGNGNAEPVVRLLHAVFRTVCRRVLPVRDGAAAAVRPMERLGGAWHRRARRRVLTWPFASAYFQLREVADMGVRSLRDLVQFSADTYAFVTPPRAARLLSSWLNGYPKAEGAGFPGFTILTLAAIGLVWGLRRFVADLRWTSLKDSHAIAIALAAAMVAGSAVLLGWFFVNGSLTVTLGARMISIQRRVTRACGVSGLARRDDAGRAIAAATSRRDRMQRSASSRCRPWPRRFLRWDPKSRRSAGASAMVPISGSSSTCRASTDCASRRAI